MGRDEPIPRHTLKETSVLYPDVPHSWLDNGRLLRLHEPKYKGNLKLFQNQWKLMVVCNYTQNNEACKRFPTFHIIIYYFYAWVLFVFRFVIFDRYIKCNSPINFIHCIFIYELIYPFQPVLVSNCHKLQDKKLWNPDAFSKDFGKLQNDLVNCRNGVIIVGHIMKHFWEGFERIRGRLKCIYTGLTN